ncbi:MAG: hypothetical protein ACI9H6_000391 [Patiriisocius sp.]|jgi:hypothetical protein
MFGFSSKIPQQQCGVIIDIGSGSVGVSIIVSDVQEAKPEIVWSHRTYVLIKDIADTAIPMKEITTSLVNSFLQLGSDGMKKLHETHPHLSVGSVQVTISAPWTYTITKSINFTDEHPFEVGADLIEELSQTAEKQAFVAILENEILQESQLEVIDNATIRTTINGYPVVNPRKISTREVIIAHIIAITHKKIISVLEDSKNKIIPKAELTTHSFMYLFYDVLKNLNPDTSEACLIDVTSEATEIGVLRDETLTHVTHDAFGTFSLAREISLLCKIPKEEAYTYMKGGESFVETKLSAAKLAELKVIIEAYEDKVAKLFKRTGDALAIPKTLFLHCETHTEAFFTNHIAKAAKKATGANHSVHPITSLLFKDATSTDTAILLSAHYYHRKHVQAFNMNT